MAPIHWIDRSEGDTDNSSTSDKEETLEIPSDEKTESPSLSPESSTCVLAEIDPCLAEFELLDLTLGEMVIAITKQLDCHRSELSLDESSHRYTLTEFPGTTFLSASTLKGYLFKPFAAYSISQRVAASTLKLTVNKIRLFLDNFEEGSGDISSESLQDMVFPGQTAKSKIYEKIARNVLAECIKTNEGEARLNEVTATKIRESWSANGRQASEAGTQLHKIIEFFFTTGRFPEVVPRNLLPEMCGFCSFANDFMNDPNQTCSSPCTRRLPGLYAPVTFELPIYDRNYPICGTIDALLARHTDGRVLYTEDDKPLLTLCDWKLVTVELRKKELESRGWGKPPLKHLRDSALGHYTLQQNVYRYILEHNYNVVIEEMWLIQFIKGTCEYSRIVVDRIPDRTIEMCFELALKEAKHAKIAVPDLADYRAQFSPPSSSNNGSSATSSGSSGGNGSESH